MRRKIYVEFTVDELPQKGRKRSTVSPRFYPICVEMGLVIVVGDNLNRERTDRNRVFRWRNAHP